MGLSIVFSHFSLVTHSCSTDVLRIAITSCWFLCFQEFKKSLVSTKSSTSSGRNTTEVPTEVTTFLKAEVSIEVNREVSIENTTEKIAVLPTQSSKEGSSEFFLQN